MRSFRLLLPLLLVAASAAAEPELRLSATPEGAVVASWTPDPAQGEPAAWNLYRGDLLLAGFGLHEGGPEGRCSLAPALREVSLPGHADRRPSYYYLLTSFDDAPLEQDLGLQSDGQERAHQFPCRYQTSCPAGGPAVRPDADWTVLNGTAPPAQLPRPVFTATNMDGTVRTEADLLGEATVMWFYPVAAGGT